MDILDETRQVILYSRELERTTAELKKVNERLQELDRLKDEFISTVTHELRTPLTSVRSLAEILRDTPDLEAPEKQQFTELIVRETQRLTRLISQVLDLQKIEAGRMEWQSVPVDPSEVIRDAVAATDQLVREKGIRLEVEVPEDLPLMTGDPDRLMQVLVNLLSNAVQFCPDRDGRIALRAGATADGEAVWMSVSDNGIGIPEKDQGIIFEKFRQVKDPGRGRPRGTGLGLSIVRRIVEQHGGTIGVESAPGRGATFLFRLPVEGAPGP
jgi:signal transduction histidine kinase